MAKAQWVANVSMDGSSIKFICELKKFNLICCYFNYPHAWEANVGVWVIEGVVYITQGQE